MSIKSKIADFAVRHSDVVRKFAGQKAGRTVYTGNEITDSIKAMRNVYNMYMTEFANLKSENIKMYLDAARRGLGFFKSVLLEDIKRKDLQIGGVCQTRKLAITGKHKLNNIEDYVICEDEEMRQFVIDNLERIDCSALTSDITDANISGLSLFEINFEPGLGGKWYIKRVDKIPNEYVIYDIDMNSYKFLGGESRDVFKLRNAMAVPGNADRIDLSRLDIIELIPEKLLEVHSYDGNSYNGLMNGCSDALIWTYLFKNYVIKDLATFIELFAIPAIIGKYDAYMGEEDRNKFTDAVLNFGNYLRMVVPKETEVTFVTDTNKGSSSDIFHKSISYWDEKIAIRVLGQSLTTQMSEKGGAYAASKTHEGVREDIIKSDISLVENSFDKLIRKLIDINYANVQKYPIFRLPQSLNVDAKKTLSEVYLNIKNLGYKIGRETVENEFETSELEETSMEETSAPAGGTQAAEAKQNDEKKMAIVQKFLAIFEKEKTDKTITEKEIDDFISMLWGTFN